MITLHYFLKNLRIVVSSTSLTMAVLAACLPAYSQVSITGISDRATYNGSATFTVVTQAGYQYSATLNNKPVPLGTAVPVSRMDYYELCAAGTNVSVPTDFATNMVRFIVIAADRGNPEKGLIKWTPYPLINSTAAEWAGAHLEVMTPYDYPMNLPIPVVVRAEDDQGRERRANGFVTALGFESSPIRLLRGHGSGFLPPAKGSSQLEYTPELASMRVFKYINPDPSTTWTSVSGTLSASTSWPENSRIFITGHYTIPAGVTLTIGAGTVVKLNPLVNVTNTGSLLINGTTERPVVFTSTNVVWPERNAGAWGGFLLRGSTARMVANGTIFTGGGGGTGFSFSPGSSHRSEQAVLLVHSSARASLTNCAIINTAGQVANGYLSDITFDHCLCQRAITCGEYAGGGVVTFNHSAVIEFPEDNGIVDAAIADADYDGIYFTEGTHIVLNSLVGFAMDDALDSGSGGVGTMMVSNCWVESALHEAHAWSGGDAAVVSGRKTWSYDTVLINSGQGLECGWSTGTASPLVNAERILSTANSVGTRIGDNYDWSYTGFLNVSNSMVLYNYRDIFLKSWDSGGWADRVSQAHFGTNLVTTTDARFPSNLPYDPVVDGTKLAHWMTTPPEAPVGIGLAVRTNWLPLTQMSNEVPVRLSSFTVRPVSVDYSVIGSSGVVASGTLVFAPGETLKVLPRDIPVANEQAVLVVLKNPTNGELTSISQVWYFSVGQANGTLVAQGSTWKYLDTGTDAGTEWRALDFDDAAWRSGCAQLGYGDGDECTVVSYGPSSTSKYPTTYFRQKFVVEDPNVFTNLSMWVLRDDGAVVYLNGTEVHRSPTLPAAPTVIGYQTYANVGSNADNTEERKTLSRTAVVAGTNIVAVEMHQDSAGSSDISFDFSLIGNLPVAVSSPVIQASPTNQIVAPGGTAIFSVQAIGNTPMGYQWWHNQTELLDWIGPVLTLANVSPADAGTYKVVVINKDGSATSQPATLTVANPDTDGDGMADDWELAHGLIVGLNDAALDPDHDGLTNLEEYTAGTDPQDANSFLKFGSISPQQGGTVNISFQAVAGKTYRVLFTEQLPTTSWQTLTNVPAQVSDGLVTVQDQRPAGSAERFYRLQTPSAVP